MGDVVDGAARLVGLVRCCAIAAASCALVDNWIGDGSECGRNAIRDGSGSTTTFFTCTGN
jgi:hypothetical protein